MVPLSIVILLFFIQNWSGTSPSFHFYLVMSINHEKHTFVGFIVTIFYSVNIFRESGVLLDEFYATIILGEFT